MSKGPNLYESELKCDKCTKVLGTSSYPIPDGIDILCIGCSEKRAQILWNRIENDLEPKYRCDACKTFEASSATDVFSHILKLHKEIPTPSINSYIKTIQ